MQYFHQRSPVFRPLLFLGTKAQPVIYVDAYFMAAAPFVVSVQFCDNRNKTISIFIEVTRQTVLLVINYWSIEDVTSR